MACQSFRMESRCQSKQSALERSRLATSGSRGIFIDDRVAVVCNTLLCSSPGATLVDTRAAGCGMISPASHARGGEVDCALA
eukprot:5450645-Prorocentrum_lima.AAC.1